MATRKEDVSLDALNPFDLEGTAEDIALVERGLAIMARKQIVWGAVVESWKKQAGILTPRPAATVLHDVPAAHGTGVINVAALIQLYRTDQRSPYHTVHFRTRENYESLLRRLEREHGSLELARCKAEDIQNAYEGWVKSGATTAPHSLITMLRGLFGFGATVLGDNECERISVIMHKLKFPMLQSRNVRMSMEQIRAIIGRAHEKGLHSIALGQAIQAEFGLRQRVVIGEWVPVGEAGESDIKSAGLKWLRGLRWGDLDPSRVAECPLVKDAIDRITSEKTGPMIVYEKTKLPYLVYQWRREWRTIATEVGVPKAVYNMDSRGRRISLKTGNGEAHQGAASDDVSSATPKSEARH